MNEPNTLHPQPLDENEQIKVRREKLKQLRESQKIAFVNGFKPNIHADELLSQFDKFTKEQLEEHKDKKFAIAGRIMLRRLMGKASFVHIQDMSGRIQAYIRRDDIPEGRYAEFKQWDIGDIVGIEGYVFKTKTGELSIHADNIELLTKSLRPLPDKFHGLTDQEIRYRQRYVDLIMNEETRRIFAIRSQVVDGIREFLKKRKFMEVETPMMQVLPGGAAARPFKTHHNALDLDLYLRVAPELFLKRLVVGGFDRVFEVNRNFRNEGISVRHNPEFTMLEFYMAYATYTDLMNLTEEMLKNLFMDVLGTTLIPYEDYTLDFGKPFARLTLFDAILQYNKDLKTSDIDNLDAIRKVADKLEIPYKKEHGLGKLQLEVYEKTVEPKLINPTFITAYPAEVSPLARRNDDNPFVTDRFEFIVAGRELANGFSELNDPEDQEQRFAAQAAAKSQGDDEAMPYDHDYIRALEHGLPPTAGEGIGIDRLVMLFTNSSCIRDVILFPHMKPV